jgi:hypothetical protein
MPPNDAPSTTGFSMPRASQNARTFVAPLREIPPLPGAILAAAVAAMVEIDDLGGIGQSRIGRLIDRMVEARAAVEQEQGGLLPHDRTFGDELGALDVEE